MTAAPSEPSASSPNGHTLMHAIVVSSVGGPEVLRLTQVPEPILTADTLLVDVTMTGVNYIDTYFRSGTRLVPLPWTPGGEAVGRVRAVGADTRGFAVGDRVCWATGAGAYASVALAPAAWTAVVPDDLPDEAGLALAQGLTAHFLACDTAQPVDGAVALVHAAAGGVGSLLTQMLTLRGVRVIAAVSSETKVDAARAAGAQHVVVSTGSDFVDAVHDHTDGAGVDVVYDGVGRDTFAGDLRVLARRGALVVFGESSGAVGPVDLRALQTAGSITLQRPRLSDHITTRAEFEGRVEDIFDWMRSGDLRLMVGGRFPLDAAAEAHRSLEGRRTSGKLVLVSPD